MPAARETTNAVVGTVATTDDHDHDNRRSGCRAIATVRHATLDQCAGQHRQGQRIVGCRGQHQQGDDGAARRIHSLRARQHAACGEPSGAVRRDDDFVQSGTGQVAERCDAGDRAGHATDPHAGEHSRQLPGHRAHLPALALQRAAADCRRTCCCLHRAWHPVREHDPSRSRSCPHCRLPVSVRCSRCCCSTRSSASSR